MLWGTRTPKGDHLEVEFRDMSITHLINTFLWIKDHPETYSQKVHEEVEAEMVERNVPFAMVRGVHPVTFDYNYGQDEIIKMLDIPIFKVKGLKKNAPTLKKNDHKFNPSDYADDEEEICKFLNEVHFGVESYAVHAPDTHGEEKGFVVNYGDRVLYYPPIAYNALIKIYHMPLDERVLFLDESHPLDISGHLAIWLTKHGYV